jgi:hypothetical protein
MKHAHEMKPCEDCGKPFKVGYPSFIVCPACCKARGIALLASIQKGTEVKK